LATDLTISQFAQIVLGKTETPLHLADVLTAYGQKVMPLKSTMRNLSKAQTYMFVTMVSRGDGTNLWGDTPNIVEFTLSQWKSEIDNGTLARWVELFLWGEPNPDLPDARDPSYVKLASVLKSVDASIFYLSPPTPLPIINAMTNNNPTLSSRTVIGIAGSFAGLANLNAQIIPFWPTGWSDQDWATITSFASSGDDLLLAPAQYIPVMWQMFNGVLADLPSANMILLSGS
jgi:hypothetical protein